MYHKIADYITCMIFAGDHHLSGQQTNSVKGSETVNNTLLEKAEHLMQMHRQGLLGGEVMPEDANPNLDKSSAENYLYFTLPMSLNYQRNSYTLWESAKQTYSDPETRFVFFPKECLDRSFEDIQYALTKYKIALQKQKQTEIWIKLCDTFASRFDGDIRRMFDENDNDIDLIKRYVQLENKKLFHTFRE